MIYASTKLHEASNDSGAKVFVDTSGRRKKMVMVSGICAAVGAVLYIGVVVAGLIQSPATELSTKATVSSTTKATTKATTEATIKASTAAAAAQPSAPIPPGQPGGGMPGMPAGPR